MTGMSGMSLECLWSNWSCLECLVRHTDAFLEDLLASYDWIVVLEELFVFCM